MVTDGAGGSSGAGSDRDSFSRWRDRQYYGPRRWFQSARDETQWDKDSGKNLFFFSIAIEFKLQSILDGLD